jgi:hypothetical protein
MMPDVERHSAPLAIAIDLAETARSAAGSGPTRHTRGVTTKAAWATQARLLAVVLIGIVLTLVGLYVLLLVVLAEEDSCVRGSGDFGVKTWSLVGLSYTCEFSDGRLENIGPRWAILVPVAGIVAGGWVIKRLWRTNFPRT